MQNKVHHRIQKIPQPVSILTKLIKSMPPFQPLKDPFQYYPPIYTLVFQVFPSVSPSTESLYTSLPSSIRVVCPAHVTLLDYTIRVIFGEEYRA
jgi:hypothetical protein